MLPNPQAAYLTYQTEQRLADQRANAYWRLMGDTVIPRDGFGHRAKRFVSGVAQLVTRRSPAAPVAPQRSAGCAGC